MDNAPLNVGDIAPDFDLMNQEKARVKLSDFRGKKKVVLLFYPMDFSPVCTEEHCSFGPSLGKIQADAETIVFGVSCDHPFSHAAFKKQYNIPYDLLSDTSRKMCKAYGLFMGEEPYNCCKRGTVVINKDGRVAYYQEVPTKEVRKVEAIAAAARA
ncbi:MAG TPA: redoxin domain-containing protein [Tepidisphaeraceae bacterium]|nr:redoxin domain-containing protein [Tepidisphaeraceae bacterium]